MSERNYDLYAELEVQKSKVENAKRARLWAVDEAMARPTPRSSPPRRARSCENEALRRSWGKLEISTLREAQIAIRAIPKMTAYFLADNAVPFNVRTLRRRQGIPKGFTLFYHNLCLWGDRKDTNEVEMRVISGGEYHTVPVPTGRVLVDGWGLAADGQEYSLGGTTRFPDTRIATPRWANTCDLGNENLDLPNVPFIAGILEKVSSGITLDDYAKSEYDKAKDPYFTLATRLINKL